MEINNEKHDNVRHPAHYEVYPVQPIEITRHLGFCLGNAAKYVLRAPWKNGVEDCDKALQYLEWERETPSWGDVVRTFPAFARACSRLKVFLWNTPGDMLWRDVAEAQASFVHALYAHIKNICHRPYDHMPLMEGAARDLRRILALRDTTGQIYDGLTGRPQIEEVE